MISQLKYKIGWEAVFVSLHLFVESPSDHTVKLGKVRAQHHLLAAQK